MLELFALLAAVGLLGAVWLVIDAAAPINHNDPIHLYPSQRQALLDDGWSPEEVDALDRWLP